MKPILFNTEMVRAILDGRKTVTRRLMKPQPYSEKTDGPLFWRWKDCQWADGGLGFPESGTEDHAPYKPGDILYVRETWAHGYIETGDKEGPNDSWFEETPVGCSGYLGELGYFHYRADNEEYFNEINIRWKPSIHMPKEAARIFLRVTDVRAERLQSIDEDGAIAEGCAPVTCPTCFGIGGRCTDCNGTGAIEPAMLDFVDTWNSTLKKKDLPRYGWEANPWVWVIEFERAERDSV